MAEKESWARQFFNQIASSPDPAVFLQRLVDEHKCEHDFLEFKGAGRLN